MNKVSALEALLVERPSDISTLEAAILAKAFRGELVPQDQGDEPASLLLTAREAVKPDKISNCG